MLDNWKAKAKCFKKRLKDIKESNNQEFLKSIAENPEEDTRLRKAAIIRTKDQEFLKGIAENIEEDRTLRIAAIGMTEDQEFLTNFIKKNKYGLKEVAKRKIKKLTQENVNE